MFTILNRRYFQFNFLRDLRLKDHLHTSMPYVEFEPSPWQVEWMKDNALIHSALEPTGVHRKTEFQRTF